LPADIVRTASCRCGALTARCIGEPVRVSVCHCLNCQRRSGSAFAAQARFPTERVTVAGETRSWEDSREGGGWFRSRFCPTCGSTICYEIDAMPGLIAIPTGAFADPRFPQPEYSVYEGRRHPWVAVLGEGIEHHD
jgi:hypothetical protein